MDEYHGFAGPDVPPHEGEPEPWTISNVEAEAALLGGVMMKNSVLDSAPYLRPEHFFEPIHREIFTAIREMIEKGREANPVTLRPRFETNEAMKEVGGPGYLAMLTGGGAAIIGFKTMADQVVELAQRRSARKVLMDALARLEDGADSDPAEIVGTMEADLASCLETTTDSASVGMGEAAAEAIDIIEQTSAGKPPNGFVINLFEDYNHVRGRMEGGDFDLLGGRPGMGKTAVSLAIGLGAADAGVGVEYLSLEMRRDKMVRRTLANMIYRPGLSCTYEQLIAGKLSTDDWREMTKARERLDALPFSISDPKGGMMVEDLGPCLRKRQRWFEKRGQKLGLVIIDYLGRFQARRKLSGTNEIVAYISRTIKNVASELDVCIITLAQLSRAVEQRDNKRPMLADLRDSGSLEQDADNVVFLYRDEYYLEKTEPPRDKVEKWQAWADDLNEVRDNLEIYSSKRREGGLTKRTAKFYVRHQAVRDHGDHAAAPDFFDDANHIL